MTGYDYARDPKMGGAIVQKMTECFIEAGIAEHQARQTMRLMIEHVFELGKAEGILEAAIRRKRCENQSDSPAAPAATDNV